MRRRGPGAGGVVVVGLLFSVTLALGACAPGGTSPTASPGSSEAPSRTAAPSAAPSGSWVLSVAPDASLLELLPASIDQVERTNDEATGAEIAAELAGDIGLADDIEAVAVALYAGNADYAVVTVTRLRPDRFDDAYFRDWRDTFDAAVCDQAGGVDGRAEAPIAGRTAYIGTCAGGVRTYHVHLPGPDRLVSLQALGEGRFGERILGGLTE